MSSSFTVIILSWFYGFFLLGKLVSGLFPAGGEGGLMSTHCWGRESVLWLHPTEEVGFMVTFRWGSWFQVYFPLGRGWIACVLPAREEGRLHGSFLLKKLLFGYFPMVKSVSGLLPPGGEGGLHVYSPVGERVGCMVTSHWGSWLQGYSPLGRGWVACVLPGRREGGLHGYFPLMRLVFGYFPMGELVLGLLPPGERVDCMCTPCWGRGWVVWLLRTVEVGFWLLLAVGIGFRVIPSWERVGCMCTLCWGRGWVVGLLPTGEVGYRVTPCWGRGWVACVLPAGGEGGVA